MAILFTTSTTNQPDAGSVGLAMAEKIRDDVVAHPAWDLVEEFTPSGGAVRWYVLKCLGSANGLGSDFFLVIGRTLASGELRFAICEGYNPASHTMTYLGTRSLTTPIIMDASGRSPNTFTLGAAVLSGVADYLFWIPSGTSTKWWITVSEDGFTVAFNGASNGYVNVGAYVPLSVLPNNFPIMISGSANPDGLLTRNPAVAGITLTSYGYALKFASSVALGFTGFWQFNDKLQNNQRPVAEVGMVMTPYPGQSDWMTIYGYALGKHKRMRTSGQVMPGGFAFGDAFAMNGTLWVPYKPDVGVIWDTGVASS